MTDFLVSSPEGAVYFAEQDLFRAEDPHAALIATIHETQQFAVGNVWERFGVRGNGEKRVDYSRILDERVIPGRAVQLMLNGEVMRLVQSGKLDTRDLRNRLGIVGLINATSRSEG